MKFIEKISNKKGLLIGMITYLLIGLILSLFVDILFLKPLIVIVIMVSGYKFDFKSIDRTEIVSVVNSLTKEGVYNASETIIWTVFGLLYVDGIYDKTEMNDVIQIRSAVTKDMLEIAAEAHFYWYIVDPLLLEKKAGWDDLRKILLKKAEDLIQAHIKKNDLNTIESTKDDVELDDNDYTQIKKFFSDRGASYDHFDLINIDPTEKYKEAREKIEITKYEEADKSLKNQQFRKRVQEYYLDSIIPFINGKSFDNIIVDAKNSLNITTDDEKELKKSEISILNEAVKIAENLATIDGDKLYFLKKEAKEQAETIDGFVPKKRIEGFEGTKINPFLNMENLI